MIDRAMFLLISTKGAERLLIDLLYRHNDLWKIVDYKTDKIDSKKQQKELTDFYQDQLGGHIAAFSGITGKQIIGELLFSESQRQI
ncbi:MAG: hypothetical protein KAR13_11020 [Desulfobulbaceae bacterium]|nr:hypothetical protein [Desulfobulbaceae bacterium]